MHFPAKKQSKLPFSEPLRNRVMLMVMAMITIRLAAFWFLTIREWTHTQRLEYLPLVLLLVPEILVIQNGHNWTLWTAVAFSVALCLTTAIMSGAIAIFIWRKK